MKHKNRLKKLTTILTETDFPEEIQIKETETSLELTNSLVKIKYTKTKKDEVYSVCFGDYKFFLTPPNLIINSYGFCISILYYSKSKNKPERIINRNNINLNSNSKTLKEAQELLSIGTEVSEEISRHYNVIGKIKEKFDYDLL